MDIWKNLKRRVKYTTYRAYIKYARNKPEEKELSETQLIGIKIVKKMVACSESEIILAPLSQECYIRNEEIYIKLSQDSVQIINGKYLYDIYIPPKWQADISNCIYQKIEKKKKIIENKIKSKSNRTLKNILEDINNLQEHGEIE